jgi:E3 ubiquitin-protein ligase DOA10
MISVLQMVVWVVAAVYNIPVLMMFDIQEHTIGVFCFMTSPLMNMVSLKQRAAQTKPLRQVFSKIIDLSLPN